MIYRLSTWLLWMFLGEHISYLLVLALSSAVICAPEVTTSQGRLFGHTFLSRDGREYNAFNGIPYAQPPVDNLRFMAPLPGKPWAGILNATVTAPFCYQEPFLANQTAMQGQEDCLYLNVYSPKLDASYPVMVYIHGGAFKEGWPGTPMKPSNFMDENVVIVTLSYRLGYLGFLSLEDDVLPGNYGLKDQLLALEWVKKEITNFGGNPDLITAFGISAGGASTHYLCSTPKGRAILKACISQSGVAGAIWSLHRPGEGKIMASDFAKSIGCGGIISSNELLTCLQSKPLESFKCTQDLEHITEFPGPVLEKPSDTAVIIEWPMTSDFPWLAGSVANEGLLITEYVDQFATPMQKLAFFIGGDALLVKALHLKLENVVKDLFKIKERFFRIQDFFHILTDYERFFTEAFWNYPFAKELKRHTGPKYFYKFGYEGGPSLWEAIYDKKLEINGVCHGDDGFYFFNLSNYYQPEDWPKPKDIDLSKTLVKMWVNFATHQNPSTQNIQWDQFGDFGSYLDITNDGLIMKNYTDFQEVIDFWSDIE